MREFEICIKYRQTRKLAPVRLTGATLKRHSRNPNTLHFLFILDLLFDHILAFAVGQSDEFFELQLKLLVFGVQRASVALLERRTSHSRAVSWHSLQFSVLQKRRKKNVCYNPLFGGARMNQDVCTLSDEMLLSVLDKRVECESANKAEMIDCIREIMHRRLWLEFGATSMFDFMTRAHFHYAPVVAQRKIDAARLLQALPEIKELVAQNEINLTQLGMVAAGLRQKAVPLELQREIVQTIKGQTMKNTQVILNEKLELEVKSISKARVQRDGSVRVEMTFTKEEWAIIERAKELVSHSVPSGELKEVLTYCVGFTVAKKTGSASTSLKEVKVRQGLGVSRSTRRLVFERDQNCRHVHANGERCNSRYQLQVDHIISRWRGGEHKLDNLQLLCGVHNRSKYADEIADLGPLAG